MKLETLYVLYMEIYFKNVLCEIAALSPNFFHASLWSNNSFCITTKEVFPVALAMAGNGS